MNAPIYRALRFVHPDLDVVEGSAGLRLSPTGGIEMVQEHASVRQAILLLLSTLPGERVMRPDYGCALHRLVFSPNDETTAGLAIHTVRQALERWEPRIRIRQLDAVLNKEDPSRLDIFLEYQLRLTQHTDRLVFPLSLRGEPVR